ncbi:MAG: hotdog domain-containing protein [Microbacteriaceae bacterium]
MNEVIHTLRKWVKPEDLNQHGTLFGGSLLRWIDEEAAIVAIYQIGNTRLVTKYLSEINFVSSARQGDMIELQFSVVKFGTTSITMACRVEKTLSADEVVNVAQIVLVGLDENGVPQAHGFTETTLGKERISRD